MQFTLTNLILLAFGIAIGFIISRLLFRRTSEATLLNQNQQIHTLENEKSILNERNNSLREQFQNLTCKAEETAKELMKLNAELASQKTLNETQEESQLRMVKEFENLANKILDDKSAKFTEQNKTNLDVILNPLKDKIKDFETKVENAYKTESAERNTLKGAIEKLFELNRKISDEANNLTKALKGDNKQQGNWGELVLERILEGSGLMKDHEYKTQFVTTNNEGDKIKPDVVVFLPDDKHIIIDSKVSLTAYEAFINAEEDNFREQFRKEHIQSMRSHIKLLGEKNYQTANGLYSPDFVLLFVPIESSLGAALQADQELFNYAWDRKIVLVSPSTLLATLRTVASIWKQEKQTKNALLIAEEGGKLYDKFVGFVEDLIRVGVKMDSAKKDYADAMNKLTEGSGNIVRRAEKMKELGAKATKYIPPAILERAEENPTNLLS